MQIYVSIYIHTSVHILIENLNCCYPYDLYTCARVCMCMYVRARACGHVYICNISIYMYICNVCIHMYTYVYVCIHIYIYTYTYFPAHDRIALAPTHTLQIQMCTHIHIY